MEINFQSAHTLADVRALLRNGLTPHYGEREAAAMARAILMHLKGWSLTRLLADEDREASDFVKGRSDEIFRLLMQDVPLQYALGDTTFYGLKLKVRPGVLIPRPETEELVDLIVSENRKSDLEVLDLCTGSGAIAIALARNLPFSRVEATDISPQAVEVARENATELKVKVAIKQSDVFNLELPADRYDIIVSNPPYVAESEKATMEPNVLNHEPHIALFVSDENPLIFYRHISMLAAKALVPGGRLYYEINPLYAPSLKEMLESLGYQDIRIIKDIHGKDRFAAARTPSA